MWRRAVRHFDLSAPNGVAAGSHARAQPGGGLVVKGMWGLTSLKITMPVLEMEWESRDENKNAAGDFCVKLITRAATQHRSR